ncbi:hypothetical protein CKAN_00214500 [Cinnamomum micranthum f. kanehirae]|uniref:Uncharacterized protein n=1 Tax=Cinnamomum micranthum f. kanehirae TaxID=337451 RepID=A0A3S3MS67_9MAGN|nr:hypothetical protein CKAN_00214500 [Cinnamomum micranthum f. kanehirae]
MEPSKSKSKAIVVSASTPSESLLPLSQPDSQLSLLLFDVSQQVQVAMENMLKLIGEIDQSSAGIMEDIERSKESSVERKKILEEERERFQKAAFTVLEMLNTAAFTVLEMLPSQKEEVHNGLTHLIKLAVSL